LEINRKGSTAQAQFVKKEKLNVARRVNLCSSDIWERIPGCRIIRIYMEL